MKVYHLTREVYEGVVGFSHGFAMKQDVVYVPNRGIIAQNPQDKSEFFYITDKKIIEEMQNIVDKEKLKAINADTDEVYALLSLGKEKKKISKEFNKKAKSLFELVMKGGIEGVGGCLL